MLSGIDEYLAKASSVTCYDVANRFNIRMSVARKILREKEAKGELVPYIREGGFVVYTTPAEMDKRAGGVPIMISDVFEEIASTVTSQPVITDEMDEALLAAGTPGAVKPSKLARKRRERGERKERKDERPEVIVEPLPVRSEPEPEPEAPKKEEKPKKAAPKKTTKKEEKPKKAAPKKTTKKEEKPKKAAPKKTTKKEEKPKKAAPKKTAKKEEKPKKAAPKKTAKKEEKPKKVKAPKLQDLPGVGPKMEESLRAAGIKTVKKLAGMDLDKLTNVDGVGKATAESLIKAAKDAI